MEDVQQIASYISQRYEKEYGRQIDEMKLHKLLYLTQREAIIETGEPLFEDQFEAWKYGPVLYSVHKAFQTDKDSWSLSTLSHGEYSWRKAREGYDPNSACRTKIRVEDIRVDAQRIKQRRIMLNILGA